MRKLTERASKALIEGKTFSESNTSVIKGYNFISMLLHGNEIIKLYNCVEGNLYINFCGYPTGTTKERINGFLKCFGLEYGFATIKGDLWFFHRKEKVCKIDPNHEYNIYYLIDKARRLLEAYKTISEINNTLY